MISRETFFTIFSQDGIRGIYRIIVRSRQLREAFFVVVCADIMLLSMLLNEMLFLDFDQRSKLISMLPASVVFQAAEFILSKYINSIYTDNPKVFYCLLAGSKIGLTLHVDDKFSMNSKTVKFTCELGQLIGYSCQKYSLDDNLVKFGGINYEVEKLIRRLKINTDTHSVAWTIRGLYCSKVDEEQKLFTLTKWPFLLGSHDTNATVAKKIQILLNNSKSIPLYSVASMKHIIRFYTGQVPPGFRKPIL